MTVLLPFPVGANTNWMKTHPVAATAASSGYTNAILGDPYYQQSLGLANAQSAIDYNQLIANAQQALIQAGQVPTTGLPGVSSSLWGAINTPTLQGLVGQANSAGLSAFSRLQQQHDLNQRGIQNNLAARGILQSGELPWQLNQEGLGFTRASFDQSSQLMQYLAGAAAAYARAEAQRRYQVGTSYADAAQRQAGLPLAPTSTGYTGIGP